MISRRPFGRAALLGPLLLAACLSDPIRVDGEQSAPGAPAQVVRDDLQYAGGNGLRTRITIDSASSTWTRTSCRELIRGATCSPLVSPATGSVERAMRDLLFTNAHTPSFRALRAAYARPGGVTPPDFAASILTITAGERTRQISWERGAALPQTLSSFSCYVDAAMGALVNCPPP